jgi:hypothetical protein
MIESLSVTDSERETLWRLASSIVPGYNDFTGMSQACWRASGSLPARLAAKLYRLRQGGHGPLLFKRLASPCTIPPTPSARGGTWSEPTLLARQLMGLLLAPLGHLYNFKGRCEFDVIDDVFPVYAERDAQLGTNRRFLEWHVEDGFHPAKADWIALYCLRGDPQAHTHLCEARDLRLAPELRAALERPDYSVQSDSTLVVGTDGPRSVTMPVLSPGDDPEIVYDPAYTRALTPASARALDSLHAEVERVSQTVVLEHGDLLLIDNRRVLHARSAYDPSYDGSDRWLLRALMLESIWKVREHLNELETGRLPTHELGDTPRPGRTPIQQDTVTC